jgi:hypothetical protein
LMSKDRMAMPVLDKLSRMVFLAGRSFGPQKWIHGSRRNEAP